jgi:hypothetical protein
VSWVLAALWGGSSLFYLFGNLQQEIILSSKMSRPAPGPTQLSIQWVPGVKRPRFGAADSPASRAVVRNEWNHTSSPSTYLREVHGDNFTFSGKFVEDDTELMAPFLYYLFVFKHASYLMLTCL